MIDEPSFIKIATLIGEPARARMLWSLLDGRAYTASELAMTADISPTAASNHLAKLLEADLLKVERQGRHRYYAFSRDEIAYAIESLANLVDQPGKPMNRQSKPPSGIRYCRSCYDHLAGYVGVQMADAMQFRKFILLSDKESAITAKGWDWLGKLDIDENAFRASRRPWIRPCLDWSERRTHVAGQLGAVLLRMMLTDGWFRPVRHSRELVVTAKGQQALSKWLGIELSS